MIPSIIMILTTLPAPIRIVMRRNPYTFRNENKSQRPLWKNMIVLS